MRTGRVIETHHRATRKGRFGMNPKTIGLAVLVIVLAVALARWVRKRRQRKPGGETYPFF